MTYKESFIKFMVDSGVLTFGEFTLKSGRKAPYFINTGNYKTGAQLSQLGKYYAECIKANNIEVETLFGPAYKGIPLSVSAAVALYDKFGVEVSYCFDRKEAKDHGDEGILLGSKIKDGDRVVIIEDVTTSGKSIEETYPIVTAQGKVEIVGEIISLNRMEKGLDTNKSALEMISEKYGFKTCAIVTMDDVVEALYEKGDKTVITPEIKKQIDAYYLEYGCK